jgi:DNA replication and repair protein RecF
MFLDKITLLNFKIHASLSLPFSKKINCFIGKNGTGKTNIIDSIYYLCLTKSYFNSIDQQNILFGNDFFRLDGELKKIIDENTNNGSKKTNREEKFHITYKLPANKRKELIVNDVTIPKLSDHIGNFPCIIISPDDSQLILGNSEERRKFLDGTISQINHQYLEWLITYQKVLAQRNAALKRFAETKKIDRHLIESYDKQLLPLGTNIHGARKVVVAKLQPIFQAFYKEISLEREMVSFSYYSQLNEKPFADLLHDSFDKDVMLQRTDAGIHKDDLDFFISNNKMKKFGSQGQQKSFIISMKFAQYELIKQNASTKPVMLIDDIFDKLDNDRSRKLIDLIAGDEFGQIFLTDTDDAHIRETLKGREELFEVIQVGN